MLVTHAHLSGNITLAVPFCIIMGMKHIRVQIKSHYTFLGVNRHKFSFFHRKTSSFCIYAKSISTCSSENCVLFLTGKYNSIPSAASIIIMVRTTLPYMQIYRTLHYKIQGYMDSKFPPLYIVLNRAWSLMGTSKSLMMFTGEVSSIKKLFVNS